MSENDLKNILQLIALLKNVQIPFLHFRQSRHKFSLDGIGLRGLGVDSVNSPQTNDNTSR
jgi:hypothetical protein